MSITSEAQKRVSEIIREWQDADPPVITYDASGQLTWITELRKDFLKAFPASAALFPALAAWSLPSPIQVAQIAAVVQLRGVPQLEKPQHPSFGKD